MHTITRVIKSALKAALFFTLFAFALNNQDDVTVHFFFGHQWTAPMVLIVFTAFASGLFVGVLGTVPRWWRQRSELTSANSAKAAAPATAPATVAERTTTEPTLPPHGI